MLNPSKYQQVMMYSAQFSAFTSLVSEPRSRYNRNAKKMYQVDIEGFDGEMESVEIEAANEEEAAEAAQSFVDFSIYNVNVYAFA